MTRKPNSGRKNERRRGPRFTPEDLVVYYWTGGLPCPHRVREINAWGGDIISPDVFYPGTMIWLSVHAAKQRRPDGGIGCSGVWGQVVRGTPNGFCVEFLFESRADRLAFRNFIEELRQRGVHEIDTKDPNNTSGTVAD